MKLLNFIKTHKMSILPMLLVVCAVMLGADCGFAMAIEGVDLAAEPNPSTNINPASDSNPEGRPDGEAPQEDEQGGKTQLQGKSATATDVRDAGIEAEDYDPDIVNFRKFRFPIEVYIANKCRPVKCSSYERSHFRVGSTDLDAIYGGADIAITGGSDASISINSTSTKVYDKKEKTLTLPASLFENPECLTTCSTIYVSGVDGFDKNAEGKEVTDGELALYVLDNPGDGGNIKFLVSNPPTEAASSLTIGTGSVFMAGATACSESQIRVAPETFLPEKRTVYLQKMNMTCIITNEFEEQDKKVGHMTKDVLASAMFNFRRKCARTHWLGKMKRTDVKVKELGGNREACYESEGILRQIPMLYTHGDALTDDDMMAITSLMFTDNSATDSAVAFCGKREMKRIMKLVNSATHFKDVSKVEVNDYGIKVRKWTDNFGSLEFIYDPTLDDIRYQDFMVIVDLENAVRYYKRNEKDIKQDMSKSGESREATAHNKSIIDCVCLKGYNAVLVCPSTFALKASKLGGIEATFESVASLPTSPTAAQKAKRYYLTADDTASGFQKGTVVEWSEDIDDWKEFEGLVRA
jgi:hypothetical protein